MRTKYTINELLFKLYLICVVLGCLLRNMLGEWKTIYDTYTFVSKGRWGTFFLSFSSIILFVLIFRCIIHYIKKVHAGIRILLISLIFYYLIWTVLSLDKAPIQSVFFEAISTSVILLPALLELFMNTISASGWLSSKRISSPAVYPAPPMIPTLIISIISIGFFWYDNQ